jgi:hypothetical protein
MTTATVPPELDDGFVGDMLTQCALALDHGEGSESDLLADLFDEMPVSARIRAAFVATDILEGLFPERGRLFSVLKNGTNQRIR